MVSIVDPIGKRVIGLNPLGTQAATSPPEAHLRGPENYDTPRSRDIFNVARRLEVSRPPLSPLQPPQRPRLLQRLLRLIGYGSNNNKKKNKEEEQPPRPEIRVMTIENFQTQRHTCQYQRTYNPTHRLLPEEHIAAWRKRQHEREQISKNNNTISSKRQFHGPIPKRPNIDPLTTTTTTSTKNLSPLELEIYHTIRPIGRCATFTPFTTSSSTRREQIMLVHPTDLPHLQHIQNLAREISPRDKSCMVKSLEGLLIPQLVAVLKILLRTRPEVRITSRSGEGEEEGEGGGGGGGGGTGKVGLRRPASWEIFAGGVRDSWEQVSVVGGLGGVEQERMGSFAAASGDLGGERGKSQKKEKKRRIRGWWRSSKDQPSPPPPPQQQPLSIFKSFSQKEFMPELTLDSSASSSSSSSSSSPNKKNPPFQPHLRGGGGGDDASTNDNNKEAKSTPFPFVRSTRVYLGRSDGCLNDAERVPRTLFWLAGGRVSPRMKAPTAGELRRRRQVERVNRREVGFVGTLFGVRRVCKVEGDGVGGGGGEIGADDGDGNGEDDGG